MALSKARFCLSRSTAATSPERIYWGVFLDSSAFLTQLSADGSKFLFSTYLGGSSNDDARGLAVDASGSAYVVGNTRSGDFPVTSGAYETNLGNGGPGFENTFVAKYPNTLATSTGTTTTAPSTTTTVSYSNLTSPGTTAVTTSNTGPPPPANFNLSGTYYDFTTTATFSGNVTVCVDYIPADFTNALALQLLHYQGGSWVQVTSSNDTTNGVICGVVSSLSPFAISDQNVPLAKSQCKDGEWQLWRNPAFKNQGQCVSFVNHS
jgi:hypothetical protein